MNIFRIVYILMPVSIILAFIWAPPAQIIGETSRILYFHVPLAWVSVLAFAVSGIFSILYLFDKRGKFYLLDEKACNSANIGIFFTILTTILGSMWAKINWGTYWNWDPRETSIIILMLIYIAYFSLRSALNENENRGKITSAYLIFAMVTVPFFIFIIPRIYPTLHPDPIINPEKKIHLDNQMRITLIISVISYTLLYFYLLNLLNKLVIIKNRIKNINDKKEQVT